MQEWWDDSAAAGPKTRPASRFEDPVPSMVTLSVDDCTLKIHS